MTRHLVGALALGFVAVACSSSEKPDSRSHDIRAELVRLDSCTTLDSAARPQDRVLEAGETVPLPHPGTWETVKRVSLDSFSIEVPTVATVSAANAHDSHWISGLPGCRYSCGMEIILERDSVSRSLDQYVASLRVVDTTTNPDAADWVPGPPRVISVGGERGLIMETSCGDCMSGQAVVKRGRTIAHIMYSLDVRDYQPGLMCRMARIATTFQWRST
jgi:hypothetical protein